MSVHKFCLVCLASWGDDGTPEPSLCKNHVNDPEGRIGLSAIIAIERICGSDRYPSVALSMPPRTENAMSDKMFWAVVPFMTREAAVSTVARMEDLGYRAYLVKVSEGMQALCLEEK